MENKSDYNNIRTRIDELLPTPYQSDAGSALMENTVNRLLTKKDTQYVDGFVGQRNPLAINSRQIQETDIISQANQLQPVLTASLGTERRHLSWQDVISELTLQGIDMSQFPEWGAADKYNWVPPVDIDKVLNFRDYFWVDPNQNNRPEYITIANIATRATARANAANQIIERFGETLTPTGLVQAQDAKLFSIAATDAATNTIKVRGDVTGDILPSASFSIVGTMSILDSAYIALTVTYDVANDWTVIAVASVLDTVMNIGRVDQTVFNGLTFADDLTALFEPNLLFFVRDTLNDDLDQRFHRVVSSTFADGQTTVILETEFNNPITDMTVSLTEQTAIAQEIAACELDPNSGCATTIPTAENQWASANAWVHRTDVENFASARQANYPIIEFLTGVQLNEYVEIVHDWRYRTFSNSEFIEIDATPNIFELQVLHNFDITTNNIIFDRLYGDMTNVFVEGYQFADQLGNEYTVVSSTFRLDANEFKTCVEVDVTVDTSAVVFMPRFTSQGDVWLGINQHWLYAGIKDERPTATPPTNIFNMIDDSVPVQTPATSPEDGFYDFREGANAQEFILKTTDDINKTFIFATSNLRDKIVIGSNDLRVYINGIRQYGTYTEVPDLANNFLVGGITFDSSVNLNITDVVLLEIGPVSIDDIGLTNLLVRVEPDDAIFNSDPVKVWQSAVRIQRIEQIKTEQNIYPQFNIFTPDGMHSGQVSNIFGYETDSNAPVSAGIGLRVVVDSSIDNYTFRQELVAPDGTLLCYTTAPETDYWVDTQNRIVFRSEDFVWADRFLFGTTFGRATYSDTQPPTPVEGMIWFNSLESRLFEFVGGMFEEITSVVISGTNPSLSSIWQKSKEQFVPILRDWNGRSEAEYNAERDAFVASQTPTLIFNDPTLSAADAEALALVVWFNRQQNSISVTGEWIGDWTLPDFMYFNINSENRPTLTSRELTAHIESIINSQARFPAYFGDQRAQFHLLNSSEVDLGAGGTIQQYNNNFSTFLSSVFVDNIIVPDLVEFAQDQYQILLDTVRNLTIENIGEVLATKTLTPDILPLLIDATDSSFSENSNLELIYGDTTSYDGTRGVRNWIATLPNFGIVSPVLPQIIIDADMGIYEVMHHDGHIDDYAVSVSSQSLIIDRIKAVIANDPSVGIIDSTNTVLPSTYLELLSLLDSAQDVSGGFKYINTLTNKIYNLSVEFIQVTQPSPANAGELWIDIDTPSGTLKISDGITWNVVTAVNDGKLFNGIDPATSTVSAWQEIDISNFVVDTIADVEKRLFDISIPQNTDLQITSDLEEYFLTFIKRANIEFPFTNTAYSPLDAFSWNYYQSVFGQRFDLQSIDLDNNSFTVSQTVAQAFPPNSEFFIKNSRSNNGTWTVVSSTEDSVMGITEIVVAENIEEFDLGIIYRGQLPSSSNTGGESAAYWKALYQELYGTPYPHLEPWILQGYTDKPTWWDVEYRNDDQLTFGNRRWKYDPVADIGMWKNIRTGIVPVGRALPNGEIVTAAMTGALVKTYNYLSVNISHNGLTSDNITFYDVDSLLPPFFDFQNANLMADHVVSRSLFSNFGLEILNPAANFVFGQNFQLEYDWRNSSQHTYDTVQQAYRESPINFLVDVFGYVYHDVDGLLIDADTNNVPKHSDVTFHGTIRDNEVVKVRGINQWYINYNRYTGVDTNFSNFLILWKKWTAPLAYQFSTFIDVRTFDVENRNFDIENNIDYNLFVKKTKGVESFSISGIEATLLDIPPKVIDRDNSHLWKIQISNKSLKNNIIKSYDVKNFPFHADPVANLCTLYAFAVTNKNNVQQMFELDGDVSEYFVELSEFTINDQTFTVLNTDFIEIDGITRIFTNESLTSINIGDVATASIKTLPWETGDSVWLTTERTLPAPLFGDTPPIGPIQYFIIRVSDTEFRLAETNRSALANLPIELINGGQSQHHIGQIVNTFFANNSANSANFWRHYALDKRFLNTVAIPSIVNGMQEFIDLIDGYVAYVEDIGFDFSEESFGWQQQLEDFIDYSFSVRDIVRNRTIGNRFSVQPDSDAGHWVWNEPSTISLTTGMAVNVVANTGVGLPAPFLPKVPYFVILNTDGTFNLAVTRSRAISAIPIPLIDSGSSAIEIYEAVDNISTFPRLEVNSFKNKLTFRQPFGVVSDIIEGPFDDINITNSLLDQFGNPLLLSDYVINRFDTQTEIALTDIRRLDTSLVSSEIDFIGRENYHYISSAMLFVDTYEHIVEFENYTADGNLLYDSFIGLNIRRMDINFNKQAVTTLRPNLGGSMIVRNDQNLETVDNPERMVDDLRFAYGSVDSNESNRYAPFARSNLGYDITSTEEYLDSININENSQFLFWKGLIQVKGSTKSVDAFINSKNFEDAQVDEFWAYEIAEFGTVEDQDYPQMFLNTDDIVDGNAKFEFIASGEPAVPGLDNSPYDVGGYDITVEGTQAESNGFISVSINDTTRWYRQPDQLQLLENNGLILFFETRDVDSMVIDTALHATTPEPVIHHGFASDSPTIIADFGYTGIDRYTVRPLGSSAAGFDVGEFEVQLRRVYIPFTGQIRVFMNGVALDENVDFANVNQTNRLESTVDRIRILRPLEASDIIDVSYLPAKLSVGRHYENINADIVRFFSNDLFLLDVDLTIFNSQSNFEAHNASKLVDVQSDTVVTNLNLFDPARGVFNQSVAFEVDIQSDRNPAIFNVTENNIVGRTPDAGFINKSFWGKTEVGTIWLDSSELSYVPYYDAKLFTDVDDRLQLWGEQTDYSQITVFEWVESNVPPSEYDALVPSEQGNTDIPEHLQKSGNARRTPFQIVMPAIPENPVTFKELRTVTRDFNVIVDGTSTGVLGEYSFDMDSEFSNSFILGTPSFDIYVNGLFMETQPLTPSNSVQQVIVGNLRENDQVTFVVPFDYADDILDEAEADQLIVRSFEFTQKTNFDANGQQADLYYFWVENKLTRGLDSSVSPQTIESSWTGIDIPYIVLQGATNEELITSIETEEFDVDYVYTITENSIIDTLSFLQLQTAGAYNIGGTHGTTTAGGTYQIGDVITLINGAIVEITQVSAIGEVLDFVILFAGDAVQANVTLTPINEVDIDGDASSGAGFTLRPSPSNISGFTINLGTDIIGTTDANGMIDYSVELSINGRALMEKSVAELTNDFLVRNNKQVDVFLEVTPGDIIGVKYTSIRPRTSARLPSRHTQAIVRNIRNFVNDSNRYTVRFRKDFTNDDSVEANNKAPHREWKLFRENQRNKIDRVLWDAVIESMIGYKLDDVNIAVPNISRVLYDQQNFSDTQYGLDDGQSFTNGVISLQTLMNDLNSPENNFRGIDIASFFALNTFDTGPNIANSMAIIYDTFATADVNRLFFLFLADALSLKREYAKILKTSMISVHGVKILNTRELFDD